MRTQSSSRSLILLFTVAKKRAVARHDAVPARGHPIRKPAILNESKFSKPTNEANVAADVLKERVSQANCERAIQSSQKRESSDWHHTSHARSRTAGETTEIYVELTAQI